MSDPGVVLLTGAGSKAFGVQGIHRNNAQSPAGGGNADIGALKARQFAQGLHRIQKVRGILNPDHPGPFKGRGKHLVCSHQGAGMGERRLGPGLGPSSLQDQDGLGAADPGGGFEKRAPLHQALHVEDDYPGVGVVFRASPATRPSQ